MKLPYTQIRTDKMNIPPEIVHSICIPQVNSHKGENGRLLLIGGSHSFHAASLWAAETASHIVDIVHYASTKENNEILLSLRKKFRNGIVVQQEYIPSYIEEDDAILIGPGMERGETAGYTKDTASMSYSDIMSLTDEAGFTYHLIEYLIRTYPDKKFIFDAAALQMLNPDWLRLLSQKPILTPHQKEFENLFQTSIRSCTLEEKVQIAYHMAQKYNCVILLKAVTDIVTDGVDIYLIEGGNQGLTKGGTGDVLAGLTSGLFTKNTAITASVAASYILKETADTLYDTHGYWYNVESIISSVPFTLKKNLL